MYFSIHLALLTWQLFTTMPKAAALQDEMCPFYQTVNLTTYLPYENGSYTYRGIIIPPKKVMFYDYIFGYRKARETVSPHLRGCVCEERRCLKLCCSEAEYFNGSGKCTELLQNPKVDWNLQVQLKTGINKTVNAFENFAIQVGLPCANAESLHDHINEYILQEDGKLYFITEDSTLDTLDYCYSPWWNNISNTYELTPFSCPKPNIGTWQLYLNTYAMTLSVAFFVPTIVVYLVLKELRGSLCGKLLICYLISLSIGYSIISFINISRFHFKYLACSVLGYTCYFFFMAAFFWLSAFFFEIWVNFKETSIEFNANKNCKQFVIYSLYAWLCAGLSTFIVISVQLAKDVDEIYKPGIGTEICWLNTEKWSALYYFYGPSLIILLLNFVTFTHLAIKIYKVRREITLMTNRQKSSQENAIVILRLFLIMGISWLFDTLSYCLRKYEKSDNTFVKYLFVLPDFANATQGVLIFTCFVMKKSVLELLKVKFHKSNNRDKPKRSISTLTSNLSRFRCSSSAEAVVTP